MSRPRHRSSVRTTETIGGVELPINQVERVKAATRHDGVAMEKYEPRFPVPGTQAEKRAERRVALMFLLAFLGGAGYMVITIIWPWRFQLVGGIDHLFTPLLGLCMALALFGVGAGLVLMVKTLMPAEDAVQERHDGFSPPEDRAMTGAILKEGYDSIGLGRRSLLKRVLGLTGLGLGAMALAPFAGFIKNPKDTMFNTPFRAGVKLVREDGTPVKPADIPVHGFITVYPGVKGGILSSDGPTLLFHLDPASKVIIRPGHETWHVGDYYAYSKICTHAGCPASLWEDQTGRILCPCHQSQFDVLDGCRPVFGPAARSLPQLPIELDRDGFFVAKSDYHEAVGPSFWERG
jgi:ubiquinol-cytochrome c reductase iron-sulfur subunit